MRSITAYGLKCLDAYPLLLSLPLLLLAANCPARAQGLSPTAPTKEFIYFGGHLVAVEERGPGGAANVILAPTTTTATASAPSKTAPVPPEPVLPDPRVPPHDSSSNAGRNLAITPANTHTIQP